MLGALNQLVGSHQRIPLQETQHKLTGTSFSFRSTYVKLIQMVRSYPSVVRRFQIGGLNSSLGVSEPSCTLGIMYLMHIGSLGMLLKI